MVSPDISLGICTHKVEKISAGYHPILRRPRKSKEGKWISLFLSAESFFWGIGKQSFMLTGHRNSRTSCGICVGLQPFCFRPAVNTFHSADSVNTFCMNTKLMNTWSTVPFRHTHMGRLCILRHYVWLLAYVMVRHRVWYHRLLIMVFQMTTQYDHSQWHEFICFMSWHIYFQMWLICSCLPQLYSYLV